MLLARNPDLWHSDFLRVLLSATRPEVSVEIGIATGGTTKMLSKLSSRVYAVDVDPAAVKRAGRISNVVPTLGDSTQTLLDLASMGVSADFVFIDGDHRVDKVMADFEAASRLLSQNGIIAIHDTYPRDMSFVSEDNEWCGDSYLAPARILREFQEWSVLTIPVHPGLTLCQRKGMAFFQSR